MKQAKLTIRQYFIFNAPDIFLRFLIKHKALEKYLVGLEYNLFNSKTSFKIIDSLLAKHKLNSIILSSFFWPGTKPGKGYWSALNSEWESLLNKTS